MWEILRVFDVRGPQRMTPTVSKLLQGDLERGGARESSEVEQHARWSVYAGPPASVDVRRRFSPLRRPLLTAVQCRLCRCYLLVNVRDYQADAGVIDEPVNLATWHPHRTCSLRGTSVLSKTPRHPRSSTEAPSAGAVHRHLCFSGMRTTSLNHPSFSALSSEPCNAWSAVTSPTTNFPPSSRR